MLGGVRIPFDKGSLAYSDGDVLIHAICDALLGATALGDIGRHFPDTAPAWRNASSLIFLRHVGKLLEEAGYKIVNVDSTIGLEKPKLASYIPRMLRKIAAALHIKPGQVSVKAKTGEGLGAIGRSEAVRADAVVVVQSIRR
jgi:2-C-methyl-D-erythritol 2,4-cyclodiphosphate synthase